MRGVAERSTTLPSLVVETARRTIFDPATRDRGIPQALVGNFSAISTEAPLPADNAPFTRGFVALSDTQLPYKERHGYVMEAFAAGRIRTIKGLGALGVIDAAHVLTTSHEYTAQLVNSTAEVAASYPGKPPQGTMELLKSVSAKVFSVETLAEAAVAGYVTSELVLPYIADRMLSADWGNAADIAKQAAQFTEDVRLIRGLSAALSPLINLSLTGATEATPEQIADKWGEVGPLGHKIGQSLGGISQLSVKSERTQFLSKIGEALQEGALPVTPEEEASIVAELPEQLTSEGTISRGSIGDIRAVTDPSGRKLVTKVKRRGLDKALSDNVRVMEVFVDGVNSFVRTHAAEGVFTHKSQTVADALPFGLRTLEKTVKRDLDFPAEQRIQHRAAEVFEAIPGVVVPQIMDEYSDAEHITMEYLPAESIKNLPASSKRVENLMTFTLQSWRQRFFHGDLHGRNIKSREDGSLVVYDWSKSVTLSPRFVGNLGRFMYAMTRQNPKAIAKAYHRIQAQPEYDGDPTKVADLEDIERIAGEVIQRAKEEPGRSKNPVKNGIIQDFMMSMGINHQSALDVDYFVFLKSAKDFRAVVKSELEKPEYQDKRYRRKVILQGLKGALKTVYLGKR